MKGYNEIRGKTNIRKITYERDEKHFNVKISTEHGYPEGDITAGKVRKLVTAIPAEKHLKHTAPSKVSRKSEDAKEVTRKRSLLPYKLRTLITIPDRGKEPLKRLDTEKDSLANTETHPGDFGLLG